MATIKNREIAHNRPFFGEAEERASARVLRSSWVAQGPEVRAFEKEFCDFLGLRHGHAVAVSSGTAALFVALLALRARGKKVALPVYACSALRNAVSMAGGMASFLDSDGSSPNVAPASIQALRPAIAVVAHIYGIPVDCSGIRGTKVIEDCAQALGATVKGVPVGLQGDIGIFSFYATKLISSGGQGGMVVSRSKSLVDFVRDFRDFDCRKDRRPRFNLQMTDLQAAIGRVQLKRLSFFIKRRSKIFDYYRAESGLQLLGTNDRTAHPVRYRAVAAVAHPKKLIKALAGIGARSIIPLEDWELLDEGSRYPRALRLSRRTVSIPLYPALADSEIERIGRVLRSNSWHA